MFTYAERDGLVLALQSKFNVKLACGMSRSHSNIRKFGLTDAMPALKYFFHVWIDCSAKLRQWEFGDTNWNFAELDLKACFNSPKILLSNTHTSGLLPVAENLLRIFCHAFVNVSALRSFTRCSRMHFASKWYPIKTYLLPLDNLYGNLPVRSW